MCAAALQQTQFNAADLGAGSLLDHLSQQGGKSAQLRMTEAVCGRGLCLRYKGTVGIVNSLRHCHHAIPFLLINTLHVCQKLLHVEVYLRKVNQIRACTIGCGKTSSTSQPASVAAHNLNNANHASVIYPSILVNLHAGGCNIFGSGSESGAMVCSEEVVVNGFRNSHDAALVTDFLHIFTNLIAGIHRVVAAIIEEIADIIFFEDFQDTLVICIIYIRIGHFIPAGAKCRRGRIFQKL